LTSVWPISVSVRGSADFDPWSLVPESPFLARFRLFEMNCTTP